MATTWIDFKALRSKLRLVDVLQHYHVQLKIKGDRAQALCPLPNHPMRSDGKPRTASFSANLTKGIWQCFGCKASGNVLDFAAYMEKLDPNDPGQLRQAAILMQERFVSTADPTKTTPKSSPAPAKATLKSQPMRDAKTENQAPLQTSKPVEDSPKAVVVNAPLDFELKHLDPKHPYLLQRGFTHETIEHFGLGFCAKGMMADRIAIPLHNSQGQLIGYAGRLVDDSKIADDCPKYRFPGTRERNGVSHGFRKSLFLYNGHRIATPVDDLIIVEGFASVWWLHQHGYSDVVALMGTSISVEQTQLIRDVLPPNGRMWIMTDGDEPGERCAHQLFSGLAPHHFVRWMKLDAGQPTDLLTDELTALLWRP